MRSFFTVALLLLTAACAHVSPESQVGVVIESGACFEPSSHDNTPISIFNGADRSIVFSLSGASGPPYSLHPWAFEIAPAESAERDPAQWDVILEHYFPPTNELRIGPGDRAEVRAYTSFWPTSNYLGSVKLRVRDTRGHSYESTAIPVCAPASAPNNSFKPKPLRGSA